MNQLFVLFLALPLMVAGETKEEKCYGVFRSTFLICYNTVFEPDEPVHLNVDISMPAHGYCDDRCVNYTFPNIDFMSSAGSIGEKTFSSLPETTLLRLSLTDIKHIDNGALCSLPNLKSLELSLYRSVKTPVLTESLLSNCEKLKNVILMSVPIEDGVFKSMSGLEDLEIQSLDIPHLTKDYLEPLVNLKHLKISKCNIEKIDAGIICLSPKLEELTIVGDKPLPLLTKAAFENCESVTVVDFKFNHSQVIEEGTFSGFANAKTATISGANIGHLKKEHLLGFNNVETLKIVDSGITKVDPDAFSGLEHLRELHLRSNLLTEFDTAAIAPLPNLEKLDLRYNKLTKFDHLSHQKLEKLWVSNNDIKSVNVASVKTNFPNLKKISTENNPINKVDEETIKKELEDMITYSSWNSWDY